MILKPVIFRYLELPAGGVNDVSEISVLIGIVLLFKRTPQLVADEG